MNYNMLTSLPFDLKSLFPLGPWAFNLLLFQGFGFNFGMGVLGVIKDILPN
jgi:hypothetical protein